MNQLKNYAYGQWIAGAENGQELFNAITGDAIATVSSKGLDFAKMCDYARTVGAHHGQPLGLLWKNRRA